MFINIYPSCYHVVFQTPEDKAHDVLWGNLQLRLEKYHKWEGRLISPHQSLAHPLWDRKQKPCLSQGHSGTPLAICQKPSDALHGRPRLVPKTVPWGICQYYPHLKGEDVRLNLNLFKVTWRESGKAFIQTINLPDQKPIEAPGNTTPRLWFAEAPVWVTVALSKSEGIVAPSDATWGSLVHASQKLALKVSWRSDNMKF